MIVADIATDPLWDDFRHLALPHGLRACWSVPVLDGAGEVLATCALYQGVPAEPTAEEVELVTRASHLIRIVIERDRSTEALQRSEAQYRALATHIPALTWVADRHGGTVFVSPNAQQVTGSTAQELTAGGKSRAIACERID